MEISATNDTFITVILLQITTASTESKGLLPIEMEVKKCKALIFHLTK